jgi:hypothetical protein
LAVVQPLASASLASKHRQDRGHHPFPHLASLSFIRFHFIRVKSAGQPRRREQARELEARETQDAAREMTTPPATRATYYTGTLDEEGVS